MSTTNVIANVVNGLECIRGQGKVCGCCPYSSSGYDHFGRKRCKQRIASDAIALLKEQENEIDTLKTLILGYETGAISEPRFENRSLP